MSFTCHGVYGHLRDTKNILWKIEELLMLINNTENYGHLYGIPKVGLMIIFYLPNMRIC